MKSKKLLAMLMVVFMTLSMLPSVAFAADENDTPAYSDSTPTDDAVTAMPAVNDDTVVTPATYDETAPVDEEAAAPIAEEPNDMIMLADVDISGPKVDIDVPDVDIPDDIVTEEVWLRGGQEVTFTLDSVIDSSLVPSENDAAYFTVNGNQLTIKGKEIMGAQDSLLIDKINYAIKIHSLLQINHWAGELDEEDNFVRDYVFASSDVKLLDFSDIAVYPEELAGYSHYSGEFGMSADEYGDFYVYDIFYVKEDGTSTIYCVNDEDRLDFLGAISDNGEQLAYPSGEMYIDIDGERVRVFCVQPNVPTSTESKYEAEEIEENLRASLISIFGQISDSLFKNYNDILIWQEMVEDYSDASNNIVKFINLDLQTPVELNEEEKSLAEELQAKIEKIIETYTANEGANFTLVETKNATFENNVISLQKRNIPAEITLYTDNTEILSYYENGLIQYPDGVTGEVNAEAGTLTLTVDTNVLENGAKLVFSMIPESEWGKSVLYTSNYGKQSVVDFNIENPNTEEISFVVTRPSSGGGGIGDTYVDVTVSKEWKLENGGTAANSVDVQLLRDGVAYGEVVTLSADNDWTYTWENLVRGRNWTVEEVNVPANFTSKVERIGNLFTIVNTDVPTTPQDPEDPSNPPEDPENPSQPDDPETPSNPPQPEDPDQPTPPDYEGPSNPGNDSNQNPTQPTNTDTTVDGSKLPQTGQNWMLVGALALAGIALLAVSRHRKEEK